MILLFATQDDSTCREVSARLAERGARAFVWRHDQFPASAEISLRYRDGATTGRVVPSDGDAFDLADVRAIWLGQLPRAMDLARVQDRNARRYLADEATAFLRAVLRQKNCRWVPGSCRAVEDANDKATQLAFAEQLGFEIPPTVITNSPGELKDFYREHGGHIISKTFSVHHIEGEDREAHADWWFLDTRVVSHRRIAAAATVRDCPSIFQAYVPKALELRITVVADRVFACEIHSQDAHHTRHDWRRYDVAHTPHREHALPREIEERCLALLRGYGLCYGAIDMIKTPDHRYVFLELNTTAEYVWIEQLTGMPISDALCDLLQKAERGEGASPDLLPGQTTA